MDRKAEYVKTGGKKENAGVAPAGSRPPRVASSSVDHVLHLQRTVGNGAVQRLYETGVVRARLKIGDPGDAYEREADRVADKVLRMPGSAIRMNPT